MKTSTLIIILIGLFIIISTLQHKKKSDWTDYAQGGFEADDYLAGAEAIGTGALAKKNEEEGKTTIIWDLVTNPKTLVIIVLFLIFMFGGANFIFRNPILIAFGLFALIIIAMGGKRK
mgnify:CR=1 FL=1